MPRRPREINPDGIYRVATRGSDQRPLFAIDRDREEFLGRLEQATSRYELACLAYCLMGNHYHLVVQTPDGRLSRALQELHTGYSTSFNRFHGHRAHLFCNRFLSREIDSDAYLLTVCRYIVLNPVRAGMCDAPGDWPWSSYRASAGLVTAPPFLDEARLCEALGGRRNWRERYRDYVETSETETSIPVEEMLLF
jgi:REP element-mobilizing transposase RayT